MFDAYPKAQTAHALAQRIEQLAALTGLFGSNRSRSVTARYFPDLRDCERVQPCLITHVHLGEKSQSNFVPNELSLEGCDQSRRLYLTEVVGLEEQTVVGNDEPPLTGFLVDNVSQQLVSGGGGWEKSL